MLAPQKEGEDLGTQLAAAVQVGGVVATHMMAVSSLPLTPEIQRQKIVIGAMLKEVRKIPKCYPRAVLGGMTLGGHLSEI